MHLKNDTSNLTSRKGTMSGSIAPTVSTSGTMSESRGPPGMVSFHKMEPLPSGGDDDDSQHSATAVAVTPPPPQQQKMMGSERIVSASKLPSTPPTLSRSPFLSTSASPMQFATSRGGGAGLPPATAGTIMDWHPNKYMVGRSSTFSSGDSISSNSPGGQPPRGRLAKGGSQALSPIFAKLCALCTLSIFVMAATLGHLDHQKSMHEVRHYRETDVRKRRSKARKLRDYMMENGVDEPVYVPASTERYLMEHGPLELGYNGTTRIDFKLPQGCAVWKDPEVAPEIYEPLHTYVKELKEYNKALKQYSYFAEHNIPDVRKLLTGDDEEADYNTCQLLELGAENGNSNQDLLQRWFSKSGQLSRSLKGGWIEPLLTPMRHPHFCTQGSKGNTINVDYLVHDFAHICRHSLKPHSRVVLFDLGASSKFAGVSSASLKLILRFQQFGIPIDHLYAYEIKPTKDPFKYAPRQMQAARDLKMTYHWVTGGVSTEPGHELNPFTVLQKEYNQDDLIIVKMDIDITTLEMQLAQQLIDTPELWRMVDLFYFEHHVHMDEMKRAWKTSMSGSIQDSLQLFTSLRERGIPAHFWI